MLRHEPPLQLADVQVESVTPSENNQWVLGSDDREYRRGVYMHWQRTFLQPMLANFDAPSREECTATRTVANTPQQALTLLTDPTFVEAARVLAQKLLASPAGEDAGRLDLLYRKALARPAKAAEKESLTAFLAYFTQILMAVLMATMTLVVLPRASVCA